MVDIHLAFVQALLTFRAKKNAEEAWEKFLAVLGPENAAKFEQELERQMRLFEWEKTVPRPPDSPFLTVEKLQYARTILAGPPKKY